MSVTMLATVLTVCSGQTGATVQGNTHLNPPRFNAVLTRSAFSSLNGAITMNTDEYRCRIAITGHGRLSCFWKYLGSFRVSFAFPPPGGRLLKRMRTLTVRFIIFISGVALVCAALSVALHRRVLALTAEKPFAQ